LRAGFKGKVSGEYGAMCARAVFVVLVNFVSSGTPQISSFFMGFWTFLDEISLAIFLSLIPTIPSTISNPEIAQKSSKLTNLKPTQRSNQQSSVLVAHAAYTRKLYIHSAHEGKKSSEVKNRINTVAAAAALWLCAG
jgi:hypothetical protein